MISSEKSLRWCCRRALVAMTSRFRPCVVAAVLAITSISLPSCETWAEFEIINEYDAPIIKMVWSIDGHSHVDNTSAIQPEQCQTITLSDDSRYRWNVTTRDGIRSNDVVFKIPKGNYCYTLVLDANGVLSKRDTVNQCQCDE